MNHSCHPGDWLWVIVDGRFVALTPEAYSAAWALGFGETPDAWAEMQAKGGTFGDYLVMSLRALERSGKVRVETREAASADDFRWPVYAVVPPEERAPPPAAAPKRGRRKRGARVDAPALALVPSAAVEPAS